ncbi:pentatricopeptide repeat-containing protein At3g57430, chloroplastic-like [Nicotiana tabacum]|uniref:Pentatricopeptide repeat-containing protein At3g57430, chloroplastic-like n=1 Tax=Nicotiana tabacum TaxID=4097 RepID=A0A1S4C2C4_TOBAC|nr:PREDICTED: pentatricopeptide repeat-containing protein At3g57430, chloroplastic-like [Nicotiana tabacum]
MSSWTCTLSTSPLSLPLQQPSPSFTQNPPRKLPSTPSPTTTLISKKFEQEPTSETPSAAPWIDTLRSQVRLNCFKDAILTYIHMTAEGIRPDNFVFPAVLKAATGLLDLNLGKQIHGSVVKLGYDTLSSTVANSLIHFLGQCGGSVDDVYKVFDRITQRDQVSWNSLINALCKFEKWELALEAFRLMGLDGFEASSFTLVSVALACSNLPRTDGLRLGKQVHGYSLRIDDRKTFTNNALISMYAKLGRVDDSRAVFELFANRDIVSWNTIISSFSQNDQFKEALDNFSFMIQEEIKPDGFTISSVLPACSHLALLDVGKQIHCYVLKNDDLIGNSFVASALVDMYCNCQQVESGREVFDSSLKRSIGLWNAMLAGFTQNGFFKEALLLFTEMLEFSGISPNPTTMASVLPACVHCEAFTLKEVIHGYVIKLGFADEKYVQNALMDLYSRMGKINISKYIFDSMESKDIVSWNTLITGFVVCGYHEDALILLHEMQTPKINNDCENDVEFQLKPNSITLMTVLPGCASLVALTKGKEIHAYAIRNALAMDIAVGSALVDMYAKCGCLDIARRVFDSMTNKNVITWNVLIMAYGMHGKGEEALELFRMMVLEGKVKPNDVTFIAIFAGCSHSGMVDQGRQLFQKMKNTYATEPTADHYACVVDLLGRAGNLEEAYQLVNEMPSKYNKIGAWSSLLGACRIHRNVELGEISARNLFELEPHVASHYVLLSNIYSSAGIWEKANMVRRNMKKIGVRKEPGCSWIEFGDEVHKFVAGDASHPQSEQLYGFLETLSEKMKKEGYVPDTSCVLHNVNEEEKENLLCGHSEKLAIAFGILNTPPGMPIRVAKNLRVCNDCHEATKFISKIVKREIIVRDVRRFHHFRNGTCSCRDYW